MQAFPDNTILVAQSLTAVAPMMELCDARRPIRHLSTILRIAGLTTRYWGWRKGEVCVSRWFRPKRISPDRESMQCRRNIERATRGKGGLSGPTAPCTPSPLTTAGKESVTRAERSPRDSE